MDKINETKFVSKVFQNFFNQCLNYERLNPNKIISEDEIFRGFKIGKFMFSMINLKKDRCLPTSFEKFLLNSFSYKEGIKIEVKLEEDILDQDIINILICIEIDEISSVDEKTSEKISLYIKKIKKIFNEGNLSDDIYEELNCVRFFWDFFGGCETNSKVKKFDVL